MSLDSAPTLAYSLTASSLDLADADTLTLQGSSESLPSPQSKVSDQIASPSSEAAAEATSQQTSEAAAKAEAPGQQTPNEAQKHKVTQEALKVALANYAKRYNLNVDEVTEAQLVGSTEGIHHWCTAHAARGPGAQAMNRAFKHQPDMKASYAILTDAMKLQFRKAWMAEKSFDFVTSSRSTVNTFLERRDECGTFKTQLQLEMLLGGCDKPEAVRQAASYVRMCTNERLKALGDYLCWSIVVLGYW